MTTICIFLITLGVIAFIPLLISYGEERMITNKDIDEAVARCPYRDKRGRWYFCKTTGQPCNIVMDQGKCTALRKLFKGDLSDGR